jgi:hypothetical protein
MWQLTITPYGIPRRSSSQSRFEEGGSERKMNRGKTSQNPI